MYSTYRVKQGKGKPGKKQRKPHPNAGYDANAKSGTYRSASGSEWLELRVDVDKVAPYWPVLDVFSGEYHNGDDEICFQSTSIKTKVDDDVNKYSASLKLLNVRGSGHATFQFSESKSAGWHCDVSLRIRKDEAKSFSCDRTNKFFRKVNLDIDYTSDELVLPEFDTTSIPDNCPGDLPRRKLTIESIYADIGVELNINRESSSKIDDPDPSNPWSVAEIYEVMQTERDTQPNTWNLWVLLAGLYRSKSSAGFMFDKKERKGCVIFTEHQWFKGLKENDPNAVRKFLHTLIHEMGHTFNIPHTFEDNRPDSISFMNYDWRYNSRNGPGSYYDNFCFTFDSKEILFLRHGWSKYVEPGKSSWGREEPQKMLAPPDDDDEVFKKLQFDCLPTKDSFKQTEIVSFELRLKNVYNKPLYIDTRLNIDTHNVRISMVSPSGKVTMVDPIKYHLKKGRAELLYPAGSPDGPDRKAKILNIFYGAKGYYFDEIGKYSVRASYTTAEYYITSSDIEVTIEDLGDPAIVEEYKTEDMGLYVTLGGSPSLYFNKCKELIEKLYNDEKHNDWIMSAYLATQNNKTTATRGEISKEGNKIKVGTSTNQDEAYINNTQKILEKYEKGLAYRGDALRYRMLAFARGRIMLKLNKEDQAKKEVETMFVSMKANKVKEPTISFYRSKWEKAVEQDQEKDMEAVHKVYQERATEILDWQPKDPTEEDENSELTGLGLKQSMSQFDSEHLMWSGDLNKMITAMADETNDVVTTLEYVDSLQKTLSYNTSIVHYAFELFLTHHPLARENGMKVPEDPAPSQYDKSTFAGERPVGEDQMDYFRNDRDYCDHHRHWHETYRSGTTPGRDDLHLDRQGEFFWNMHMQMLARYDAERESWGLNVVEAYDFGEFEPDGCDLGDEFHGHWRNRDVAPRPPGLRWRESDVRRFRRYEWNIRQAINRDIDDVRGASENLSWWQQTLFYPDKKFEDDDWEAADGPMNCFGHVVEATSSTFRDIHGSFHNQGHGVFGSIGQRGRSSYMMTTTNAVRDPVFYRWHKRVDDLLYACAIRQSNPLGTNADPRVSLGENDILISTSDSPPDGFDNFNNQNFGMTTVNTRLDEPRFQFEHGKLSHEPFNYHIRLRRSGGGGVLRLTLRIFICPENRINEGRRWIEMDKFAYEMTGNTAIITRRDRHSSVIRRIPGDAGDDLEMPMARTVSGFCECGWPYHMLLPRGTRAGEPYRLCLVVTDNRLDTNEALRTRCGSMSYCGARDVRYPDKRVMGYPFSLPLSINDREVNPEFAMERVDNFAYSRFVIINNDVRFGDPTPPPSPAEDPPTTTCWAVASQIPSGGWRNSGWRGRFRILIDGEFITASNERAQRPLVAIVFGGRTVEEYRLTNLTLAERIPGTLNVRDDDESKPVPLTFNGQNEVTVGRRRTITSDIMEMEVVQERSFFLTFTVETPCRYYRGRASEDYTWRIADPGGDAVSGMNWDDPAIRRQISHDRGYVYGFETMLINTGD